MSSTRLALGAFKRVAPTFVRAAMASIRSRDANPHVAVPLTDRLSIGVDPERLEAFVSLCGFASDGYLPITYPHALCALVHTNLLSRPGFPFPVFGVVHVRHYIRQERRIGVEEHLDFFVRLGAARSVRNGFEYDITTECRADGQSECAWSEITTFFVRANSESSVRPDSGPPVPREPDVRERWRFDSRQGIRFALASDDYNPIHLSARVGRLFGFKSAIAHGMWLLSKALATIDAVDGADAIDVAAYFRRPMMLPGSAEFVHQTDNDTSTFAVTRVDNEKPYLVGTAIRQ